MDLVTQAVLGAAIGQAGFARKLGRGAIIGGALFGMLPDADIIAGLWGTWASLEHHRGITHALIFAPVMCAPFGYLAHRLTKRRHDWKTWAHLAFWAMWTHPMLDVFTTYGTQLALPFNDTRYAIDGVSIIDPLYTFPLIFALILGRIKRDKPQVGKRAAWAMLIATTAYLSLGLLQARSARQLAASELERQDIIGSTRLRAIPTFANIWAWRIVSSQPDKSFHVGYTSTLAPGPITFSKIEPLKSPLLDKAYQDHRVQRFDWFADGWLSYTVEEQADGSVKLRGQDQRYGSVLKPTHAMWGVDVMFGPGGELVDVKRYNDRDAGSMGKELRALRALILTGKTPTR